MQKRDVHQENLESNLNSKEKTKVSTDQNDDLIKDTGKLLGILFFLLIIFNMLGFGAYYFAHPYENILNQFWSYLQTSTFQFISATLILPIIVIVLEGHFKILDTIHKSRKARELEKEKEERERKRKKREEHEEKQWECIQETSEMLNQYFSLASEIRFYKENNKKGASIEDLIIKTHNLSNIFGKIVNKWKHRFQNFSFREINLFVYFLNLLEISSKQISLTIWINDGKVDEKTKKLQNYLGLINVGLNYIIQYPILHIFKYSMKKEKVDIQKKDKYNTLIQYHINKLKSYAEKIKKLERKYNKLLPLFDDDNTKTFQDEFKKFEKWAKNNLHIPMRKYKRYTLLKKSYDRISCEKLELGGNFSEEFLENLARYLTFERYRKEAYYL